MVGEVLSDLWIPTVFHTTSGLSFELSGLTVYEFNKVCPKFNPSTVSCVFIPGQEDNVDIILEEEKVAKCVLDLCPSQHFKAANGRLAKWIREVPNSCLKHSRQLAYLKGATVNPFLKKPSFDLTILDIYQPFSTIRIEHVVASQFQGFLDERDCFNTFEPGFQFENGKETGHCLVDGLHQELDRGNVSLLVLLDLSAAFDIIDCGVLLGCFSGMELRCSVLWWLPSQKELRRR